LLKLKVITAFGTRPEAIKMAPVIKELKKNSNIFDTVVVVTAQHRELLDQVLNLFEIQPDYDMDIMQEKQSLTEITTRVMTKMEEILKAESPQIVLVHGDTTTTLAVSLATFYQKILLGHVEAGLRTRDKYNPFPEEINRKLTDDLSDLLFAPTEMAKNALLEEGANDENIFVTGNTVIDALLYTVEIPFDFSSTNLKGIEKTDKRIILVTAHRRENWGKNLHEIATAIKELSQMHDDILFIFPVHPNPVVRESVFPVLQDVENVILTEPLEYLPFCHLIKLSHLILTDSGGIQEEAPSLGKPVLVMREKTERPEGIMAGTVKLVGTKKDKIIEKVSALLNSKELYDKMSKATNPYGDGKASFRIVRILKSYLA